MNKRAKTTLALVGATGDAVGVKPPRTLGVHGTRLWDQVMVEYQIEDVAGVELLCIACQALDRAESLRTLIDDEGEVIKVRGVMKEHPSLKAELANRAFVVRTLQKLGLNFEPIR